MFMSSTQYRTCKLYAIHILFNGIKFKTGQRLCSQNFMPIKIFMYIAETSSEKISDDVTHWHV